MTQFILLFKTDFYSTLKSNLIDIKRFIDDKEISINDNLVKNKNFIRYSQNIKTIKEYTEVIESGHLPVFRGVALSRDDVLRREVINQLICHFELNFKEIENSFSINFSDYFSDELEQLKEMQADSLLELTNNKISVLPEGKL